MDDRLRGSTADGPLGVGTFLYDLRPAGEGQYQAASWFAVLYFPLVPRGLWTLRVESRDAAPEKLVWEPRSFELVRSERKPLEAKAVLRTWGRAVVILALAIAPAWWTFEHIEETGKWPAIRLVLGVLAPLYALARLDYTLVRVTRSRA
jgi:hypothetical protein